MADIGMMTPKWNALNKYPFTVHGLLREAGSKHGASIVDQWQMDCVTVTISLWYAEQMFCLLGVKAVVQQNAVSLNGSSYGDSIGNHQRTHTDTHTHTHTHTHTLVLGAAPSLSIFTYRKTWAQKRGGGMGITLSNWRVKKQNTNSLSWVN